MSAHLIQRVTILGTGLIGGSFALALKKYTTDIRIAGWDRAETLSEARAMQVIDDAHHGDLAPALRGADLVYVALPIGTTLDLLPDIARYAPGHALVTDACSTKLRIVQSAAEHFSGTPFFLGGHPMAGKEVSGVANADADLFRGHTYALISDSAPKPDSEESPRDPRISAFVKILEKIGARPFWLEPRLAPSTTRRHRARFVPLRSARRKWFTRDSRWPGFARFAPPRRQPVFHVARHHSHQQRNAFRGARSVRAPPR